MGFSGCVGLVELTVVGGFDLAWAALRTNGAPWRGLDDLKIAVCGWVSWFKDERIHGELDDLTYACNTNRYFWYRPGIRPCRGLA